MNFGLDHDSILLTSTGSPSAKISFKGFYPKNLAENSSRSKELFHSILINFYLAKISDSFHIFRTHFARPSLASLGKGLFRSEKETK